MRPGEMDQLLNLSHRELTHNDQGEQVPSWTSTYASVWGKKRDARGNKRFAAQQFIAEQITEFMIRHRTDVLASDRLTNTDDNVTYEILQIAEIGRHEGLDLLCRAIVS